MKRLGNFSSDIIGILENTVLDVARLASFRKVYLYILMIKKLPIKSFPDYTKIIQVGKKNQFLLQKKMDHQKFTIAFVERDGKKKPISFVNGLLLNMEVTCRWGGPKPFFCKFVICLK